MGRMDRISSVVLIVLGLFVAYYSYNFLKLGRMISPDAGFIPFFIGIALIILGLIWFFNDVRAWKTAEQCKDKSDAKNEPAEVSRRNIYLFRLLPAVLLIILYAWFFEKIGYILSTFLFMIGWQKIVERERWMRTAVIAVLCAGAMYGLFSHLLKIALPAGLWFS